MTRPRFRTAALAAAAFACPPAAAPAAERPLASIGGYANFGAGLVEEDGDLEVGILRDGEIHLEAAAAADNGLEFGVRVELEAFTDDDQIDENYGSVSGFFGEIVVGGADTALNEYGGVGVVKPADIINYYDEDVSTVPGAPGGFIGEDDAVGIRYGTGDLLGPVELGASYQPDPDADGAADAQYVAGVDETVTPEGDQFAVGASFERSFGGVALALGAGWLTNDRQDQYHAGIELGYAGATLAALWNRREDDGGDDFDGYGVGAMYETGPWRAGGGVWFTEGQEDGEDVYATLGAGYDLAPGVTAYLAGEYGDDGAEDGVAATAWLNVRF